MEILSKFRKQNKLLDKIKFDKLNSLNKLVVRQILSKSDKNLKI